LSDQGSNLDFPESKSGVLPVTPSDNICKDQIPAKILASAFWSGVFAAKTGLEACF
jgi:hypothetical protein